MTPEEAFEVLEDASDALSHASYCAIVGMRPKENGIHPQWDKLRELIKLIEDGSLKIVPSEKIPTTS